MIGSTFEYPENKPDVFADEEKYQMTIKTHQLEGTKIAEVISDAEVITSAEDGLQLVGDLYYQDFDRILIHKKNVSPAFFDLKNGLAGEILQKFSNYRVRLAIVGDFSGYSSQPMKDFIYESNRGRQINFLTSTAEALSRLSKN